MKSKPTNISTALPSAFPNNGKNIVVYSKKSNKLPSIAGESSKSDKDRINKIWVNAIKNLSEIRM